MGSGPSWDSRTLMVVGFGGILATAGSVVTIYGFTTGNLALVLIGLIVTVAGVYGVAASSFGWWPANRA